MDDKERIAELEKQVENLTTERDQYKTDLDKANETIGEKDELIEQKNQDIIGARRKYKKLDEMSAEEKAQLSEDELKRKEEQDEIYERQEQIDKEAKERYEADRQSRLNKAIDQYAQGDQELAEKIKANASQFRGFEKAYTEEEIAEFVQKGATLLGPDAPDPVRNAHNDGGGDANQGAGNQSYDKTEDGSELGKMMNLPGFNDQNNSQ